MKKSIAALCLAVVAVVGVSAQTAAEHNKNEFFGGFSHQQVKRGFYDGFNGAEGSYVRNVNRYVGIKGDFSASFQNEQFEFVNINGNGTGNYRSEEKESLYNFLGGVQIRDNASKARLKPFGHALAGVAHLRNKFRSTFNGTTFNGDYNTTGFAAAVGGGLDVRLTDRLDVRAIQADYNPIRIGNQWSNNFRFGIGIVIK